MTTAQVFYQFNLKRLNEIVGDVGFEVNKRLDPRKKAYNKPLSKLKFKNQ